MTTVLDAIGVELAKRCGMLDDPIKSGSLESFDDDDDDIDDDDGRLPTVSMARTSSDATPRATTTRPMGSSTTERPGPAWITPVLL